MLSFIIMILFFTFIYLLIAIIKPATFLKFTKREFSRGKTALFAFIAFVLFIAAGSALPSDDTKKDIANGKDVAAVAKEANDTAKAEKAKEDAAAKKKADDAAKAKAEDDKKAAEAAKKKAEDEAIEKQAAENAAKKRGKLFETTSAFKIAFNEAAKVFQSDFRVNDLEVSEGPAQNSFQVMLNDNIGIIGNINKDDDTVRDLLMIAQGDGTFESGTDMIISMGILMTAADPSITTDERGVLLEKLGLLEEDVDISTLDESVEFHGKRYKITFIDQMGMMFTVSDANEVQ